MMKRILQGLLAAAALAGPGLAPAQQQEPPQWYEVELIVFRQWEAPGDDAEAKPLDPPPPSFERVQPPAPADAAAGTRFRQLPAQRLDLHGVYRRLQQDDAYEPLLHIGWEQPGLSGAESVAVSLPADWQPQPQADQFTPTPPLHGLIRVYADRYLHVHTDLRYAPATDWGPGASQVMQQHRRMRSDELHYLDHPALGVIVQVTPMDAPPSGSAEAASARGVAAGSEVIEESELEPAAAR